MADSHSAKNSSSEKSNQGRSFSLDSLPSEHSCQSCYYCTQPPPPAEESTPELSFNNRVLSTTTSERYNRIRIRNPNQNQNRPQKQSKSPKKSLKARELNLDLMRQSLTIFFTTYCGSSNWTKGHTQNGITKYIFKFEDRLIKNAPIEYMYCLLLYFGKIIGINKKCITHSVSLYLCCTSKINALCDEMALILQTLEHHNDPKLWKYTYSCLYNISAYFEHIQPFVGSTVVIKQYQTAQITKFKRQIKAVRYILYIYHIFLYYLFMRLFFVYTLCICRICQFC